MPKLYNSMTGQELIEEVNEYSIDSRGKIEKDEGTGEYKINTAKAQEITGDLLLNNNVAVMNNFIVNGTTILNNNMDIKSNINLEGDIFKGDERYYSYDKDYIREILNSQINVRSYNGVPLFSNTPYYSETISISKVTDAKRTIIFQGNFKLNNNKNETQYLGGREYSKIHIYVPGWEGGSSTDSHTLGGHIVIYKNENYTQEICSINLGEQVIPVSENQIYEGSGYNYNNYSLLLENTYYFKLTFSQESNSYPFYGGTGICTLEFYNNMINVPVIE